jgi:hypothetical protein
MPAFTDSLAHLLAEMERIDLLIRLQISRRCKLQAEDEQFRGLYISEQEVAALLRKPIGMPQWLMPQPGLPADPVSELSQLEHRISARKQESLNKGIELRLERLQQLFELTQFDLDALLICMAVEFDLRYERLYAYLQDDVARKKPGVELALNLLAPSLELSIDARQRFSYEAPLVRFRLIELLEDPSHHPSPLLSRRV